MIMDLRMVIDKHLDRPLFDAEWLLVQTTWRLALQRNEIEAAGIAASVKQWRDATQTPQTTPAVPAPKLRADPARQAREDLLSYLFSLMAARLAPVEAFRAEVLGGKLLELGEIENWVQERARVEKYTVWLEVPVRPDDRGSVYLNRPATISEAWPATDIQLKWLKYIVPGHKSQRVATAAGAVLDRLRLASEYVASQTGCSADYATAFILSGERLPFFSCAQTVVVCSTDICSALNRIELQIDPTLSPRQVAEVYRQLRAQVFGRRYRAMSEKHVRLALFTLSRPDGEALKSAMTVWNKRYPKWRYRQESNFGRDRIAAKRRALGTLNANPTSQDAVESWLTGEKSHVEPATPVPAPKQKRRTR